MRALILLMITSLMFTSCDNKVAEEAGTVDSAEEMVQQIGDALVSMDESGGTTSGLISKINSTGYEKSFARLNQGERVFNITDLIIPKSFAATCRTVPFVCSGTGSASRTFSECAIPGGGTITGSIALSYTSSGSATCTIPLADDRVTRSPDYEIVGLRGARFKVASLTTGQTLTRVNSTTFNFASTGIRRSYTTSNNTVVLDMTSLTTSPISIIGTARDERLITGGGLMVIDNLTSASCTMSHTNVSWSGSCNCPTSGMWTVTCPDGVFSVTFGTTCGETNYVNGTTVKKIMLDRCQP